MTRLPRRYSVRDGLVVAIAGIVSGVLLWQGAEYIGPVRRVAEWQFARTDRYWPTLSSLFVVLLAVALGLLVALFVARRRARREAPTPALLMERTLLNETRYLRVATVLALLAFAGALACLVAALRLSDEGAVRTVDATAAAVPAEGPTRLTGRPDLSRIGVLSNDVLLASRDLYLAPVVDAAGRARVLVQVERVEGVEGAAERWSVPERGLLKRYPTARELAPLFASEGVTLDAHPFALFRSAATLRWRWLAAAAQCGAFGLVALLFALIARRRRRRLSEIVAGPAEARV